MVLRVSLLSIQQKKEGNQMNLNYLKRYIIGSYILVWILIIFVAGPVSLLFHAPPVVMWIVRNIIAWSPSYLLLIGWKYFRPDENRTVFIKYRYYHFFVHFLLHLELVYYRFSYTHL